MLSGHYPIKNSAKPNPLGGVFDRMTVFVRIEKHLAIKPLFDLKNGDS